MNGKKQKSTPKDLTIRSVLGVQRTADWIFFLTFEKIAEIKPLTLTDLKACHSLRAELSKDFMLDKVCMSVASCYLISRELNHLNDDFLRSKSYLQRSISISTLFFPNSCPFLVSLQKIYSEKFLKSKDPKKVKSPLRSSSAKESRIVYQVTETVPTLSTPKKKHYDMKKLA